MKAFNLVESSLSMASDSGGLRDVAFDEGVQALSANQSLASDVGLFSKAGGFDSVFGNQFVKVAS